MKTSVSNDANYNPRTEGNPLRLTVPADCAGLRLDQALARLMPEHSRSRLAQWVRESRIVVDARTAAPSDKVWGGEQLTVVPAADPRCVAFLPQDIPLEIVHEDESLLVVNKPPGLVVHPGSGNWDGTLLNALLQHDPTLQSLPRAGIVHRLDKDTSGLLVVAKTLPAQTDLVRQLHARTVRREYVAIVHGRLARGGMVEAPIGRHPVSRTRMAVGSRGKPALTRFEVTARYRAATRLLCRLETGRTHQIRVHLAHIGYPLLGDPVYGKRARKTSVPEFHRQALHAERLGLVHPATRRDVSWHVPVPRDMAELIAQLEASAPSTSERLDA